MQQEEGQDHMSRYGPQGTDRTGPQGSPAPKGPQEMADDERERFMAILDFYDDQMKIILEQRGYERRGPQDG